jgi:hypothetical protein
MMRNEQEGAQRAKRKRNPVSSVARRALTPDGYARTIAIDRET